MNLYIKNFRFWIVFSVLFYTIIGFVTIPWFIINKVPNILHNKVGINIQIKKAKFNPYTFELNLGNILIKDLDLKPVLALKSVYLNYNSFWLFEKTIYFSNLEINSPKLYATIQKNGKINLNNIMPKMAKTKKSGTTLALEFILQKLNITNGQLAFNDTRDNKHFKLNFGPYDFKAQDISTKRGEFNAHSFKTNIQGGGKLFWEGGMSLNPLKLYGNINITNLKLPKLYSYSLPDIDAKLDRGELTLNLPYQIDLSKELKASINNAKLVLSNIQISNKITHNKIIDIPEFKVNNFNLKWPKQDIQIGNISLKNPYILAILSKNSDINIVKTFAIKNKKEAKVNANKKTKAWSYLLKTADINSAKVSFMDSTFKNPQQNKLNETSLHVKNISSDLSSLVVYNFSSILNKDTTLKSLGNINQKSKILNSDIKISNLHVEEFVSYIKPFINFKIKNADINTNAKINLNYSKNFNTKVQANVDISSLNIQSINDKNLITWNNFNVNKVAFDLKKQDISINNIILSEANIYTVLSKNGDINLLKSFMPNRQDKTTKENKKSKAWTFLLKDAKINKTNISFLDKTLKKDLKSNLKEISLHVKDISSNKNTPITYTISSIINKNTKLKATGDVLQKTNTINLNLNLSKLYLNDFIAYIQPFVNFKIKKGYVNTEAKINLEFDKKLNIKVQANTSINNLSIYGNDDKNLINWKHLEIDGLKYTQIPMNISIKKLMLNEPNIRAIIHKNHSTNFSNLIKKSKNNQSNKAKKDTPLKLKIGSIKLMNGTTEFSDLSLPFPFRTNIHDLNGKISTLDFTQTTPSLIGLTGKIDKYGYANIKGKLIPIDIEQSSNISVLLKNINLSSLTPYSGKFVGYKIESGKLSMDLNYKIKKSTLIGTNKISIDTLTLGDTINSPDAVSLPLGLAIALLKDSNDQIDIDLPVSGNMNSLDFSYSSVVWGAIGHMITGIVTSPFKFLGSMLGVDGDELKSIDFDKGSALVITTEHEKLKNLQKILEKRPSIKIKLTAGYDKVFDVKELQKQDFIAIIKSRLAKLKKNKKDDNYGIVLKELYSKKFTTLKYEKLKKSFMLKQKNDANKTKIKKKVKLDVLAFNEKMQNELIDTITVDNERLINLADNRAKNIKDTLIKTYKIDITRISILPPKLKKAKRDRWIETDIEISI